MRCTEHPRYTGMVPPPSSCANCSWLHQIVACWFWFGGARA